MALPSGITRDDVLAALRDLDAGVGHDYGPPTGYELVHDGKRYPPKAVIGLAARRLAGRYVSSREFSGGVGPGGATTRLRRLGFTVVSIGDRIPAAAETSQSWDIEPGTQLRRAEVHAAYGGAPRGGIEPSGTTDNVLIFTEPEKASTHSYAFDGWAAPDLLLYTGEGRHGDQLFRERNRAVLDHVERGRALRVFRAKPPWATYLGEFAVDPTTPYYLADSPDVDGIPRQVVVFRLRPVGAFVDGGLPSAPEVPPAPGTPAHVAAVPSVPTAVDVEVEAAHVAGYQVTPSGEPVEAVRREAALVARYKKWLDSEGHTYNAQLIRLPGVLGVQRTDLFDASERELIEAKASADRNSVRTGLGQLLDYARYVECDRMSLLLPSKPHPDLIDLLHRHGCGCIWAINGSAAFARSDPEP